MFINYPVRTYVLPIVEFVKYLDEWDEEIASKSQLTASERQRLCLSTSTKEGLRLIGQLAYKMAHTNDLCGVFLCS